MSSSDQPTPAAKAAAIAVPIVFLSSLAIALVAFFWMIRRQRRREDLEQSEGEYKDVTPAAMQQRKDYQTTGLVKPQQTHQLDMPQTPLVKKSSQPKNTTSFLHSSSSRRGTSSSVNGPSKLVMPGRMNSEPFARDQGPLVKEAIRDSGLISPGTVNMNDYFHSARAQTDNMSIPSEKSEEDDEDVDLEKSGAHVRASYADSERDVEYGSGYPTTVAYVDRPSVVSTRNQSTYAGYGAQRYQAHGAKSMRTL